MLSLKIKVWRIFGGACFGPWSPRVTEGVQKNERKREGKGEEKGKEMENKRGKKGDIRKRKDRLKGEST